MMYTRNNKHRPGLARTVSSTLLGVALLSLLVLLSSSASALTAGQLYADLGVKPAATQSEIRRAFRTLTRQNHPDLKETAAEKEEAKKAMAKILRAYEVLGDADKRKEYDDVGAIPGEAPDPEEHTAEELFEYYRRSTPIVSKTVTLDSTTALRNILNFRGSRLFLIHIFEDSNEDCRTFARAWETLQSSVLVSSRVMEMYRIDRSAAESEPLLAQLGYRMRAPVPSVIAIVDGKQYQMYTLSDSIKKQRGNSLFASLLQFAMTFFYDVHGATRALPLNTPSEVAAVLDRQPTKEKPFTMLISPVFAESLYIAAAIRFPSVSVHRAERDALTAYVQDYCDMELEVKNRQGAVVDAPEFAVLYTGAATNGSAAPTTSSTGKKDKNEDDQGEEGSSLVCPNVHVGASVELEWEKLERFHGYYVPPPHPVMGRVRHFDADGFFDACRKNCVFWVRPTCDAAAADPEEAAAARRLMDYHYMSFRTGYVCLDEQPPRMTAALGGAKSVKRPTVLAILDGDDTKTYRLTSLAEKKYTALQTRDLDGALEDLLETAPEKRPVAHDASFFTLFATSPFPLSSSQKIMLSVSRYFSFVSPLIRNFLPFILVYFFRERISGYGRRSDGGNAGAAGAAGAGADGNANNSSPSAGSGTTDATNNSGASPAGDLRQPSQHKARTVPPAPKAPLQAPRVGIFNAAEDMADVQTGNGFLIVFVDDRERGAGTMPLPRVALDSRFTVRVFGGRNKDWIEWVHAHKPASSAAPASPEDSLISVVAIRKKRMTAAVKPDNQSVEMFLRDLLDGTTPTTLPLPEFA